MAHSTNYTTETTGRFPYKLRLHGTIAIALAQTLCVALYYMCLPVSSASCFLIIRAYCDELLVFFLLVNLVSFLNPRRPRMAGMYMMQQQSTDGLASRTKSGDCLTSTRCQLAFLSCTMQRSKRWTTPVLYASPTFVQCRTTLFVRPIRR